MTAFYIDHGCTLYPTAYMAVPSSSASLPQVGDGLASGAGATPASASTSMDFTTATAAAGATIAIMGATLTCVATGATSTQFNAGTGAVLAMNLATAINAATALPTTTTGGISPYLNALVWATSSGAVLTVYTRVASVALNQSSNASCTILCGTLANWTTAPAVSNFAGGVSGPWAHFWNTSALAAAVSGTVSGAVGTYGGFMVTTMGLPVAGDIVYIRTKRAGANIVVQMPTTSLTVLSGRVVGTAAAPLTFLADAGLIWSGDSGVFTISMDGSLSANRSLLAPTGSRHIWSGVDLSSTTRNWRIEITGALQTGNYTFQIGPANYSSSPLDIRSIELTGAAGAPLNNLNVAYQYVGFSASSPNAGMGRDGQPLLTLVNFIFRSKGLAGPFIGGNSSGYYSTYRAIGCIFDHTGLTIVSTAAILSFYASAGNVKIEAEQCQWLGFPAVANQSGFQAYSGVRAFLSLRDCTFDNIKLMGGTANGGLLGAADALGTENAEWQRCIQVVSSIASRPFVFENSRRSFGWVDSATPKITTSLLPDGVTSFSIRGGVSTESGIIGVARPVIYPRLAKINALADGSRTATLRLLVDNGIKTFNGARDPTNNEFWIDVSYVGTDGAAKRVSSRAVLGATAASIPTGTASDWTAVAYDVNGISHTYSAYAISVSLPNVKTLTDIGLELFQAVQSSSLDNLVFIDPEWLLV